ncbi:acyl-[acyl-carrier-protein] thioesterase [Flavonifractor hominis]|uniref:Acyl-ACP thioesterase domain-containing protein n=1 Tax=Flavonifractor hominis TaxID=3133178 RepID=A0ABV1EL52_9FIRM
MTFYEDTYRVDSRDVDPWYHCRPSGVLGILQEAATQAACALHVSRDEMLDKYGLFWMLARIWYRLDRPLRWNEQVCVRTWHRGGRGAASYRDFDLFVDGQPVGEAVSLWVLADGQTHRLGRASKVEEFRDTDGGELCKTMLLSKLHLPNEMKPVDKRVFHYSDMDVNGHVNNVRYADFICDALRMEHLGAERFVSSLQVGYLAECQPGEQILLSAGTQGESQYIHGADEAGKSRFDGAVILGTTKA